MEKRRLDAEIVLVPYFPNEDAALAWYQDPELCRQVDGTPCVYTAEKLRRMYEFLSSHGQCYYIEYQGRLVGDVTLRDDAEVCIVVAGRTRTGGLAAGAFRACLRLQKKKACARYGPESTRSTCRAKGCLSRSDSSGKPRNGLRAPSREPALTRVPCR